MHHSWRIWSDRIQLRNCTNASHPPADAAASYIRLVLVSNELDEPLGLLTGQVIARFCDVILRSWLGYCIIREAKHGSVEFALVSQTSSKFGLV